MEVEVLLLTREPGCPYGRTRVMPGSTSSLSRKR